MRDRIQRLAEESGFTPRPYKRRATQKKSVAERESGPLLVLYYEFPGEPDPVREGIIPALFLLLNEIRGAFYSEDKDGSQTSADSLIYEIIRYINENICSEQSVGAIEKMFYISRPILNKRFKRATGTTVWDYIITKRVVLADQMMSSGESATQAAYACGYNDYSSFYRAYKKVFGHPPKDSL